jgi:hypothetical protein
MKYCGEVISMLTGIQASPPQRKQVILFGVSDRSDYLLLALLCMNTY